MNCTNDELQILQRALPHVYARLDSLIAMGWRAFMKNGEVSGKIRFEPAGRSGTDYCPLIAYVYATTGMAHNEDDMGGDQAIVQAFGIPLHAVYLLKEIIDGTFCGQAEREIRVRLMKLACVYIPDVPAGSAR